MDTVGKKTKGSICRTVWFMHKTKIMKKKKHYDSSVKVYIRTLLSVTLQ